MRRKVEFEGIFTELVRLFSHEDFNVESVNFGFCGVLSLDCEFL